MYQYKQAAKPVAKEPVQEQKNQPKGKKQFNKQTLRIFESVFSIIGLIVKQNINAKVKQSFQKVKKYTLLRKKYSEFLAKKLDFLAKAKTKLYLRQAFGTLVNIKLSFYNEQIQATKKLKLASKSNSVGAILAIMQKMEKNKKKNYFDQLRRRSALHVKARNFKIAHIFARLTSTYKNKLRDTFSKIFSASANNTKKAKVCQKLQTFFITKKKRNVNSCFGLLRLNCYKLKLREIEQSQKEQPSSLKAELPVVNAPVQKKVPPQIAAKKLQNQKKQLQQKTAKLQRQLKDLETTNNKSLNNLRAQLTKLQKQNQSLKFNNDLLDENNRELEKELAQRQKKSRKKINKNQIWENVYNNLIYFLSANRDKTITKQQLIECLETPLVPCGISLDQLREQNSVLQELLNEYQNNFPEPQRKQSEPILPYDILRKKNRYYYQVLQVLSEWGTNGTKQLDKLNADLTSLQKKMVE